MKVDQAGGILVFVLGAVFLYAGAKLPPGSDGAPGAGFFPMWVGIALMLLSLPLIFKRDKAGKSLKGIIPREKEGVRVILAMAPLVIYTIFLKPLGFIITTFALFLFLLQAFERGRWAIAIIISLTTALGFYWIFVKFFNVMLPEGVFSI
jgi:putative tricarboxylic transport membrane protein